MSLNRIVQWTRNWPRMIVIAALALSCIGGLGRTAQAQAVTIGVVDEEKLGKSYKKYTDAVAEIEKRAQGLDDKLAARPWLNADESKKFDELVVKPALTPGEQGDMDKLVKSGQGRETDYKGLIGKVTKTEDDNKKIKDYETMLEGNQAGLKRLQDDLYARMKKEQEDTDSNFTKQANNVIKNVAEEKKLALVVRKVAVVWSADSIDITDEVIKKLNAG